MSRNMLMLIASSDHWDAEICLNDSAIHELNFWFNNCNSLPAKSILASKLIPDKIVYTDASSYACAGYLVQTNRHVVHKMWTSEEALTSSTYRELSAVHITLSSLLTDFKNRCVKLYTDNQNVVRIVQAGSMRFELQALALQIFDLCIKNCISLEVEWVPREFNTTADFYSKLFDFNDWFVNDFQQNLGSVRLRRFCGR